MFEKCPFNNDRRCEIWLDYQVDKIALEDAVELAEENWQEINYLLDRVALLEAFIRNAGLEPPLN